MKGISFKIDIIENVTKVFNQINSKVTSVNNSFKKTNSNIKVLPNSIAGLNQKLQVLQSKQANAFTVQGIKHYRREIDKTEKELRKLNKTAGGSGLKNMFKGVGGKIAGIGAAYLGVNTITNVIRGSIDTLSEFEKYQAVLTNTLGSSELAAQSMEDIKQFASSTPFQINELTDSYVKLANRGFVPTTLEMERMGDLASSTGKSFDQLTEAMLDAQTGEFERLKEFGIMAKTNGDKVAFTFKGVTTEVDKTDDAIKNYILSLGGLDGVSGSMSAIMETTGGQISNFKDKLDMLKLSIGEALKPLFKIFIESASKDVKWLTDLIKGLSAAINGTALEADKAHGIMKTAFNIASFIKENIDLIKTLAAIIGTVVVATKIWAGVQALLNIALSANPIGLIVVGIAALIAGIVMAWKHSEKFRGTILGLWEAMKLLGDILKTLIIDRIKLMLQGIGEIAKALELLSKGDFSGAWDSLKKGAADYFGVTTVQEVVDKSKGFKTAFQNGFAKGQDQQGDAVNNDDIADDNIVDNPSGIPQEIAIPDFSASNLPPLPKGDSPQVVGDVQGSGIKNINITIGSLVKEVTNYFRDTDTIEDADSFMKKLSGALQSVVNDTNYAV